MNPLWILLLLGGGVAVLGRRPSPRQRVSLGGTPRQTVQGEYPTPPSGLCVTGNQALQYPGYSKGAQGPCPSGQGLLVPVSGGFPNRYPGKPGACGYGAASYQEQVTAFNAVKHGLAPGSWITKQDLGSTASLCYQVGITPRGDPTDIVLSNTVQAFEGSISATVGAVSSVIDGSNPICAAGEVGSIVCGAAAAASSAASPLLNQAAGGVLSFVSAKKTAIANAFSKSFGA